MEITRQGFKPTFQQRNQQNSLQPMKYMKEAVLVESFSCPLAGSTTLGQSKQVVRACFVLLSACTRTQLLSQIVCCDQERSMRTVEPSIATSVTKCCVQTHISIPRTCRDHAPCLQMSARDRNPPSTSNAHHMPRAAHYPAHQNWLEYPPWRQ